MPLEKSSQLEITRQGMPHPRPESALLTYAPLSGGATPPRNLAVDT